VAVYVVPLTSLEAASRNIASAPQLYHVAIEIPPLHRLEKVGVAITTRIESDALSRRACEHVRDGAVATRQARLERYRSSFERELSAFNAYLPDLLRSYPGQFVAIHNGEVVDKDPVRFRLSKRVRDAYGDTFVLVREVVATAPRTVHVDSPEGVEQ